MSDLPPAGWYPDPTGSPGGLRYWDGARWTEHRHDAPSRPQHDAPQGWTQGPDGRWQPPGDGRTYGIARTEIQNSAWDPGMPSAWPTAISDPIPQSGRAWGTYRADLKWSARALVESPWLVVVTVAIYAVFELGARGVRPVGLWIFITIAAEVFLIGFIGTQRVWFLRRARGVPITSAEVWSLSWRFFGRFLCLELLCAIPAALVVVPVEIANTHQVVSSTGVVTTTTDTGALTVAIVALSFVGDVFLTFVVPALALTTRSVSASIRLAWQVMKRSWPTNAWYLFAPGITLLALSGALPRSVLPTGAALVLSLFSAVVGLWFKGANVAFYMRSVPPVGVDGAT